MKQVSQEEFERYVEELIEGKKTKKQVIEQLHTSNASFNNRVQALIVTNPKLHQKYIVKFPYKPKERKDVDIVAIGMEFLKNEKTMEELSAEVGVAKRTIRRRLDKLKFSENKEERSLYELCRIVANSHYRGTEIKPEIQLEINQLIASLEMQRVKLEINQQSSIEIRRQELIELERKFNKLCETMSQTQAAICLGTTREVIYKKLNNLYRIEIELQARKKANFKEGVKVDTVIEVPKEVKSKVEKTPEKTEERE